MSINLNFYRNSFKFCKTESYKIADDVDDDRKIDDDEKINDINDM